MQNEKIYWQTIIISGTIIKKNSWL
jgi:hypothetical protein